MRLFLTVSLAVAVLTVISVLLFNRYRTGNEAQQGTHPMSITLSRCASLPYPGLVDLCTHHQLKDLLQQRRMGEYAFVLERAYLDMNQLVLTYHVFSQATGRETQAQLDAVVTTSQGQSFMQSAGAWVSGGPQVVQFRTPPVPAQTQAIQLHVEVNSFRLEDLARPGTPPAPQLTAVHGPVSFAFTLEYHGGLIVTPHQTVTVNRSSVTLERVRISPSETIVEGTTKGTIPGSPDYTFSLNAAGRNSSPTFSGFGGVGPFSIGYDDGLLGQHGIWTFEISLSPSTAGPWVFHFKVP